MKGSKQGARTDSSGAAGGVELAELAARFGTPLYVYDAAAIRDRLARLKRAFAPLLSLIHI